MPTVALTTIQAVKDQPVTYQPLMLVRVTFPTGGSTRDVSAATNATPIAVTTSTAHGLATGDRATLYGVGGNTNANGTWTVTVTSATTFTLDNSTGSGAYTSGGKAFKNDVLRLSTHGLRTADGGFQYGGQDWLPRILNQDVAATQALSEQGVDFTPSVTLKLADPDKFLWLNYAQSKGFKGASLELIFVFWSVDTSTFSSDVVVKFLGLCGDATDGDEEGFSVTATNKMNMSNVYLPTIRVQKRCPWNFPATAAERQDGADMRDSSFWECGYSPDASGSNARGNLNAGSPYTTCNRTKDDCVARGMYSTDSSARTTGRFGGVQWAPPQSFVTRGFISGKWEEVTNTSNEAKYGDLIPFIYGTQRIDPLVLNVTGDANLTKMEVLLCWGEIDYIYEVIVNDVRIPHVNNDSEFMSSVKEGGSNTSGFWFTINKGDRDGRPNPDTLYDSKGDPYGSLAVITVVVPRKLADSSSVPRVQVYLRGPKVRVYTTPGAYTLQYSENPAWVLLDVLTWANWRYTEIDVQSFIDAAAKCDVAINYANQFGSTGSHNRYTCSLTLRQRRSAADVIRGLRGAFKANLAPNYAVGGKLQLQVKETLASQQGSSDANSNYATAISSTLVNGTAANGYVKWDFTEAHYIKRSKKSTFRVFSRQDQAPNRIAVSFQNRDNRHATESVAIVDSEDVSRVQGQEIPGTFSLDGIDNFDQLYRCVNTLLAEGYRGNARLSNLGLTIGDTGGTTMVEFETSFRVVHLKIGDIVRVSHQAWGISNQLCRVTKIQPATNFETVRITAAFHKDAWFQDTFGQSADPKWRPSHRNLLERPSYPWSPSGTAYLSGDPWGGVDEHSFIIQPLVETLADNSALQKLEVKGLLPVNTFPSEPEPPFVDQQGSTASTGGDFPGDRTYFVAVCAKTTATGTDFKMSAPSRLCAIAVPAGTNTNTISVSGLTWGTGALGWIVFAGTDPNVLTYQTDDSGTPSSITLTHYNPRSFGVPDGEFDKLRFRIKRVLHSGVWGAGVVSCTSTTITVGVLSGSNAGFTTNQWVGYDLSLLGMPEEGPLPLANWTVTANTSDTLTVTGPDPTTIPRPDSVSTGLLAGDVVVLRSKPSVGSDSGGNYVEDAGWINNLGQLEEPYSISNVSNSSGLVKITTSNPTPWLTGEKVYVQGVGGVTAANNMWVVTKIDTTNFTLDGSTFSGTYTSGGTGSRLTEGLVNDQERGRVLRFIHGPGTGSFVKIKGNQQVAGPKERIYIEGAWPVTPTSDSRYIIEEAAWQGIVDSESFNNEAFNTIVTSTINVDNYKNQTLLAQVLTVDGGEFESMEYASPLREIYVFGGAGTIGFTGAVYMNVDGNLAIGADLAPRVFLSKDAKAVSVRAEVKTAPVGADLVMKIYVGATVFMTLTMVAGTTYIEATPAQLSAAPTIAADTDVKLEITQVGTTNPGADLAVIIYI